MPNSLLIQLSRDHLQSLQSFKRTRPYSRLMRSFFVDIALYGIQKPVLNAEKILLVHPADKTSYCRACLTHYFTQLDGFVFRSSQPTMIAITSRPNMFSHSLNHLIHETALRSNEPAS